MNKETLNALYEKYFCPEGRMKRRLFCINFFATFCAVTAIQIVFILLFVLVVSGISLLDPSLLEEGSPVFFALFILYIVLDLLIAIPLYTGMFIVLRAAMRRWHDIGHGDVKFALYFYIVPVLFSVGVFAAGFIIAALRSSSFGMADVETDSVWMFVVVSWCLVLLYGLGLFLYLCCKGSDPSDNAYGTVEGGYHMMPEIRTRPRESISIWRSIFRTQGRLNRKRFIFGTLAVSLLQMGVALLLFIFLFVFSNQVESLVVPWFIAFLATFFLLPMGLYMQRMQDVGKSPLLWSIPAVLTFAVLSVALMIVKDAPPMGNGMELNGMTAFFIGCAVYYLFYALYVTLLGAYLFYAPGEEGENQYGLNPLVPVTLQEDESTT